MWQMNTADTHLKTINWIFMWIIAGAGFRGTGQLWDVLHVGVVGGVLVAVQQPGDGVVVVVDDAAVLLFVLPCAGDTLLAPGLAPLRPSRDHYGPARTTMAQQGPLRPSMDLHSLTGPRIPP